MVYLISAVGGKTSLKIKVEKGKGNLKKNNCLQIRRQFHISAWR